MTISKVPDWGWLHIDQRDVTGSVHRPFYFSANVLVTTNNDNINSPWSVPIALLLEECHRECSQTPARWVHSPFVGRPTLCPHSLFTLQGCQQLLVLLILKHPSPCGHIMYFSFWKPSVVHVFKRWFFFHTEYIHSSWTHSVTHVLKHWTEQQIKQKFWENNNNNKIMDNITNIHCELNTCCVNFKDSDACPASFIKQQVACYEQFEKTKISRCRNYYAFLQEKDSVKRRMTKRSKQQREQ